MQQYKKQDIHLPALRLCISTILLLPCLASLGALLGLGHGPRHSRQARLCHYVDLACGGVACSHILEARVDYQCQIARQCPAPSNKVPASDGWHQECGTWPGTHVCSGLQSVQYFPKWQVIQTAIPGCGGPGNEGSIVWVVVDGKCHLDSGKVQSSTASWK